MDKKELHEMILNITKSYFVSFAEQYKNEIDLLKSRVNELQIQLHEEHSLRIKLENKIDQLSSKFNNDENNSSRGNTIFESKSDLSLYERKKTIFHDKRRSLRRRKSLNESIQFDKIEHLNDKKLEKKTKKEEKKRLKLEKKRSEKNLDDNGIIKQKRMKNYFNKLFRGSEKPQKSSLDDQSLNNNNDLIIQQYKNALEEKKEKINTWNEWKLKLRKSSNIQTNEEIDLSNMELNVLPESFIISKMRTCVSLNISLNQFKVWPIELSSSTLIELNISNNSIEDIPSRIDSILNLKLLNLSNNKLSFIPKSLSKLINLEYIDLSNNNICEIPNEIEYLNKLKGIQLFNNNISILPSQIRNLKDLNYIDISFNKIISIPKEISELVNLKYIDLSYNEIESIPSSIDSLINLEFLSLCFNKLEKLPLTLISIPSIKTALRATNNPYKNNELKEASIKGDEYIIEYLKSVKDPSLFVDPNHDINGSL